MKNLRKKRICIALSLLLSIVILVLFQNTKTSLAQPQYKNETLTINSSFPMLEYSDDIGIKENVNSINLTLPSSTWNVTDIEVNFTSIKLGKETKVIEDGGTTYREISWKDELGYGVQINITEPTTLFGIYINGFIQLDNNAQPTIDVFVQIRGNKADNTPNETIYASEKINMDESLRWYPQIFSTPLELNKGYYYLVVNGSNLTTDDKTTYFWFNNEITGTHEYPNLHIAEFSGSSWSDDGIEKVLRYKLIQRVNRSYNPEDINMTIEFDGTDYKVTNGIAPFTGNVNVSTQNFSPYSEYFYVPIKNNRSIELLVNFSYQLKQKNLFLSEGSILIKKGSKNLWICEPKIDRTDGNYSVQFKYPNSWQNPSIYKDNVNITSNPDIKIQENTIYLFNDTIIEGALWNITAYSPNIDFTLHIPTTVYAASQTIKITVIPPDTLGNFTFILVDPYGLEEYRESVLNPSGEVLFSYRLPINPFEGQWKAFILWNNYTDAGLQVLELQINIINGNGGADGYSTNNTGLDLQFIFVGVLILIIVSISSLSTYQLSKRYKKIQADRRQKIFNKYMDVLNLNYIIISEKKSGVNVYEQALVGKKMDVTLISGFLQAIRSFGIELSDSKEQSQTIKLEYQDLKILMSEFKDFRIINIMKEHPSQDYFDSLKPLSYDIDKYYGKSLKDFNGEVSQFEGIKGLIEEHLQASLIYPLKIVISEEVKLSSAEKTIVNKAIKFMKERNVDHFYVSYLLGEKEFNVRNAEIILKLIEKKVFRPIE